jgi:flavodoxin
MKALIVCVSVSHGNTRRVADALADVLHATVVEPEEVDPDALADYDIVGFGSGIYYSSPHRRLRDLVDRLPDGGGAKAFVFATSGRRELWGGSHGNSRRPSSSATTTCWGRSSAAGGTPGCRSD